MNIVQNSSAEKIEGEFSDEEKFSQSFNIDEIAESPLKSPGGTDPVPTMSQASLMSGGQLLNNFGRSISTRGLDMVQKKKIKHIADMPMLQEVTN